MFTFTVTQIKKIFQNSNQHYLKKLLKTEIRDIHIHIEFIKKSLERIKKQILDSNLDFNTVNKFFYLSNSKFNSILKKCNEKQQKKFDSLSTSKYHCRKTNKKIYLIYKYRRMLLISSIWDQITVLHKKFLNKMLLKKLKMQNLLCYPQTSIVISRKK